jgi:aminopeptidase-like protein
LLDIAERAGMPFAAIHGAAQRLLQHGLLAPVAAPVATSG